MLHRIAATTSCRIMLLLLVLALLLLGPAGCAVDAGDGGTQPETVAGTAAASRDAAAGYTFAVLGDSHTDGLENGVLAAAVAAAVDSGAEFIVHTGDVSNIGAREELERYAAFVASADVPVYSLPGNHDLAFAGDQSLFAETVGPPWSSFDYGGDHFVLVDNADVIAGIGDDEMAWLAEDLAANAAKPRQFIFTHMPLGEPGPSLAWLLDEPGYAAGTRLVETASRYQNIAAYFSGHVHGFVQYSLAGVDAWITGGAGAPPHPWAPIGYYHYLLVNVSSAGVAVEVVRL